MYNILKKKKMEEKEHGCAARVEKGKTKTKFPPTLTHVHECMCVGVCSQKCSRFQYESDLDPGILLKSAGLQAKHCLSHHTQSNTDMHTHLLGISHCLVRCALP